MQLAFLGGKPVISEHEAVWPRWPVPSPRLTHQLQQVLDSGRWTLTGTSDPGTSWEEEFAEQFASFNGVPYCVPTVNGTIALRLILQALGVGSGDEILIPGLTWVACATAVTDVGAVPIFVDVDPRTACISPRCIEAAITPQTAAMMAVHLYCNVADLAGIQAICQNHGLLLIEDCAQSHGAEWGGRKVGSVGNAGAFSMHQGKPLTCGEGGAVITHDANVYTRVRQLSNNGRSLTSSAPRVGYRPGEQGGSIQGTNAVLGEFHAAILLDGLTRLPEQIARKDSNLKLLDRHLPTVPGCSVLQPSSPAITCRSPYHYLIRFDREEFAGRSSASIADALEAELGFAFARPYPPLNVHPLYQPQTLVNAQRNPHYAQALERGRSAPLPAAEGLYQNSLIFRHSILLAEPDWMHKIVEAVAKVQKLAEFIPKK